MSIYKELLKELKLIIKVNANTNYCIRYAKRTNKREMDSFKAKDGYC